MYLPDFLSDHVFNDSNHAVVAYSKEAPELALNDAGFDFSLQVIIARLPTWQMANIVRMGGGGFNTGLQNWALSVNDSGMLVFFNGMTGSHGSQHEICAITLNTPTNIVISNAGITVNSTLYSRSFVGSYQNTDRLTFGGILHGVYSGGSDYTDIFHGEIKNISFSSAYLVELQRSFDALNAIIAEKENQRLAAENQLALAFPTGIDSYDDGSLYLHAIYDTYSNIKLARRTRNIVALIMGNNTVEIPVDGVAIGFFKVSTAGTLNITLPNNANGETALVSLFDASGNQFAWMNNEVDRNIMVGEGYQVISSISTYVGIGLYLITLDDLNQQSYSASLVFDGTAKISDGSVNEEIPSAFTISGVTVEGSIPVSRPVRLYLKSTGAFVKEVISGEDGSYSFENLLENTSYFVVSHDTNNAFDSVIADDISI